MDIMTEVSQLSSFLVAPREGHMEAVLYIFAYLRKHVDQVMLFNPHECEVRQSDFADIRQWKDLYGEVQEEVPIGMPAPKGREIVLTAMVDADHAGNKVTRRSQTGFIIYGNCAPIIWFSKKQNTVEASTFGSEMIALRLCVEAIIALRFKLRSFGIPVSTPARVYCDNESVVNATSKVEGRLNKKHLTICWHRIRESCAQAVCQVAKIRSEFNVADLLTKVVGTARPTTLIQQVLRHFVHKDPRAS